MSLGVGALLSLLSFALAQPVGGPLFGDRTAGLIQLVSPVFLLLASVGAVPVVAAPASTLLQTRQRGRGRGSLTAGAGVSVGLRVLRRQRRGDHRRRARDDRDSPPSSCSSPRRSRPRLIRRRDAAGDIAGFGVPAALAGLVHVGFANADYVTSPPAFRPRARGCTGRGAFQLGVVYQEKVSGIMLRLAFPVLRVRTTLLPTNCGRLHERATRLHATTVLPLLAFLIVMAPV